MKKTLDIIIEPKIRTYQYSAFVESILPFHKNYQEWLNGNYVQTVVYPEMKKDSVLIDYFVGNIFGQIPLLEYAKIEHKLEFMYDENKVHEVFSNAIEDGYYVYTFLDEYYVPNRINTQKIHKVHDVMVYGYDIVDKVYTIIGYDSEGKYNTEYISYDQFAQAFINNNECISLLRIKNNTYEFNIHNYKEMLSEFLHGTDSRKRKELYYDLTTYNPTFFDNRFEKKSVFGLEGIRIIPYILDACMAQDLPIDYRIFYLLKEHKERMLESILYLKKQGYVDDIKGLYESYHKVRDEAFINLKQGMKYSFVKSQITLDKIKISLNEQCEQEESILTKLIELIG